MDNFNSSEKSGKEDPNKPIPFDIDDTNEPDISHSHLSLDGSGAAGTPTAGLESQSMQPTEKKTTEKIAPSDRITGVKTFFTKLHVGSIVFLDEQINNWLKDNPDIVIKRTNATTGMIVGKTTEPNIIVTVWY